VRHVHEGAHEEDRVHPERGEVEDGEVGFQDRVARVVPGEPRQARGTLQANRPEPPVPEPAEVPAGPAPDVQDDRTGGSSCGLTCRPASCQISNERAW
jgi:hypothetical protein